MAWELKIMKGETVEYAWHINDVSVDDFLTIVYQSSILLERSGLLRTYPDAVKGNYRHLCPRRFVRGVAEYITRLPGENFFNASPQNYNSRLWVYRGRWDNKKGYCEEPVLLDVMENEAFGAQWRFIRGDKKCVVWFILCADYFFPCTKTPYTTERDVRNFRHSAWLNAHIWNDVLRILNPLLHTAECYDYRMSMLPEYRGLVESTGTILTDGYGYRR